MLVEIDELDARSAARGRLGKLRHQHFEFTGHKEDGVPVFEWIYDTAMAG